MYDWLKNQDGASLYQILEHFSGSEEQSVIDILSSLEVDFLICKKNNIYMVI
ncbi:hypothetical protein EV2_005991 [Malus domestica]